MAPSNKAHVAVLAFPISSHSSALFFLARKLSEWAPDVAFSFFCTPKTNGSLSSLPTLPNLRIYDVADGLPEGHTPGNYREAVKRVDEIEKVSCVVSDVLLWFGREMAEQMGVAWVAFWIAGASALSVHLNTDLIRRKMGTRSEEVSARMDESLAFIPGRSLFRVRDLPEGIVFGPLDFSLYESLHRMSQDLPRAAAILVNTIEEMDYDPVLDHLRTVLNKCLPVGPLTLLAPTRPDSDDDPHSCLPWLEVQAHAPASVAYVGFGTVIMPPPSELAAAAGALEESGVHFLWSLKDNMRESLPAGFLDRTCRRGLVVPWTPQSRVLGHVAVGAFINHCRWNSVLESIAFGVPMIYRPFFADHRINARILSQVLGIAVEVKGGVLSKDGVMDGLDLLLKRGEGKEMRERIGALKLIAKNAVGETGSSTKNLEDNFGDYKGHCSLTEDSSCEYYYEEQASEEIPEDLQPAEEAREWSVDDVE
ncbi:anthocyanidin 3-O-glucosyltransferase 7-like protein [Cinnamomum micranthum f. kanehirae]|uniref:Anthocyanidin 3-O-glucosyltransferase 7-like protein n=1 Tax=Cinnamomum micranthum f. kanehirae TaxID=337451 RepID=A0A443NAC3_9MAGN|nr:anthocyanidin 3-O-glucosyltransferase 7-like protein [Cinnamomum micranthum f. kanehirae]